MATEPQQRMLDVARKSLAIGVIGLMVCALGALLSPAVFCRCYLVAYNFWLGISLGCLVLVMLYHLTGGGWGLMIRRLLEASTRTLPLLVLLFLPLLLGLRELYRWTDPAAVAGDEVLLHKSLYLNLPMFLTRAAVYFALWLLLAFLINRWSRQQDRTGEPRWAARCSSLSGPGLVLYGLTITFAAVDWLMSLQAQWFSTIFAVVFAVGQVLAGMAFAVLVLVLLASRPPLARVVSPRYLQDLGNLLLAFVMFWTYVAFAQFLLIWCGNLPEETAWYLPRFGGGWQWLAVALLAGQFAIPFLLLLSRDVKRNPRTLAAIAALLLVLRVVDLFWQIVPAFPPDTFAGHWLDVIATAIALCGVGGVWLAMFLWQLQRWPLVPINDPILAEVTAHG